MIKNNESKVEITTRNIKYYNDRGKLYQEELKQFDKALADFNKAIEIEPTLPIP